MKNVLKEQINLQQQDLHNYTASCHENWFLGSSLLGSCVVAVLHHVASTHFRNTLASSNQPDVRTMHVAFLRASDLEDFTIHVTDLKLGKGNNFIQLVASQDGKPKVHAMATSCNFDVRTGPTVQSEALQHPPFPPTPNFDLVEAGKEEPNWWPCRAVGDMVALGGTVTNLQGRNGSSFRIPGMIDYWSRFPDPERMDAAYLAVLCDMICSPADSIQKGGSPLDVHTLYGANEAFHADPKNAGKVALMEITLEKAMATATIVETSITMDLEWKRRIPEEGLRWVCSRILSKMVEGGRVDLDITMLDEEMKPVLSGRQVMQAYDVSKRWRSEKKADDAKL